MKRLKISARLPLLAILLSIVVALSSTTPAAALSGNDFNAGNIISDSIFYDRSTMSVGAIQAFLDSKVPVCDTDGSEPYAGTTRAQYGSSRGYPAPYICLKDYSQNTPSIINSGSDLCAGSISAGTKSAAQIIYDVSNACGINPQVLIVLLQKEQALVTDDWPWSIQYRSATGYGCPDTAPCDSEYYGFFNQVYQAAQAYRRYEANSANYNYRAGRNNTILYHPSSACGTSSVYIDNQATASLYIYTPYRPNQAALDNLYGEGDACSAYGNRNFWRLFNDWFGSSRDSYAADITELRYFSNESRTTEISTLTSYRSNTKLYVTLKAKNTGTRTWEKSFMKLGTTGPHNRISNFYDESSWLNRARATTMQEDTVYPLQEATFKYTLRMPSNDGTYSERLRLVAENRAWLLDNATLRHTISVENQYNGKITSVLAYKDIERTMPATSLIATGNPLYWTVTAQNTGTSAWSNSFVKLATSNPYNRASPLYASGWLSPARPTQLVESTVPRGEYGTFLFTTDSSSKGNYSEDLQIVAEGISWMPGATMQLKVRVLSAANIIENGIQIYGGEQIANSLYRLVMQGDGNLVIYNSSGRAIWSTGTSGPGNRLVMQGDGNLVIYNSSGRAIWSTGTSGPGNRLVMQGDGNLVIYNSSGRAIWSTGTSNR